MQYGDINLSQHRFRQWLSAWQHQAITWTNVDLWSEVFFGIHLWAMSQEVDMYLIHNMCSEIIVAAVWHHDWDVNNKNLVMLLIF